MFGYTVTDRQVFSLSPCDGQALEDRNIDMELALGPIVPPASDGLSILEDRQVFSLSPSPCDGQALEDRNIDMDLALGAIVPPPSDGLSIFEGSKLSKKEYTAIQVSLVRPVSALPLRLTSAFKEYIQCITQNELQEDISAKVFVYQGYYR